MFACYYWLRIFRWRSVRSRHFSDRRIIKVYSKNLLYSFVGPGKAPEHSRCLRKFHLQHEMMLHHPTSALLTPSSPLTCNGLGHIQTWPVHIALITRFPVQIRAETKRLSFRTCRLHSNPNPHWWVGMKSRSRWLILCPVEEIECDWNWKSKLLHLHQSIIGKWTWWRIKRK